MDEKESSLIRSIVILLKENERRLREINDLSKQYGGVDLLKDKYYSCRTTLTTIMDILENYGIDVEEVFWDV